ncbi:hypothetical protein MMC13_004070 [Lambiella insularis]|nr:hypothetical protein [Lambiella insularis]
MAYQPHLSSSSRSDSHPTYPHSQSPQFPHSATTFAPPPPVPPPAQRTDDPQFDIFDWYPKYQSCQRYFLDHAQHSGPVQAVAAFLNIHLPFQRPSPTISSSPRPNPPHPSSPLPTHVSLVPYLRRLVVTGLDFPGVLHGFFGDDWVPGVGPLHEQERRNYLFAAKSGGWASVKKDYDMLPLETVPFFRPLQGAIDAEIGAAEKSWSEWLAMEDWMVGPRAPESMGEGRERIKREEGGPS